MHCRIDARCAVMHSHAMESQNMHIHPDRIPEMEAALRDRGIPVAELCRKAQVAETTWGRWKKKSVSPTFKSWDAVSQAYQSMIASGAAD